MNEAVMSTYRHNPRLYSMLSAMADSEPLLFRVVSPTIAVTSFFVTFVVRGMGRC